MIATHCPDRETLFAYSVGRLDDQRSDDVANHLSSCPDCQAEIQTLDDHSDTLMSRLRTPADDPCLEEPQLGAATAEALARAGRSSVSQGGSSLSGKSLLLGEYQLLDELGRGGMGRVYLALHTKLDRVVALKILPKSRLEDPQAMARFEREMKAIGRLNHPNIVHATDAREIDGQPVLIMEYIDGFDLAELVRRLGRLAVADACELVRQAALGLQYAHQHGLVHRDVKPSNLMLSRAGEVKLLDLGLARFYATDLSRFSRPEDVLSPTGPSAAKMGLSPSEAVGVPEEMTDTGQAMGTADYMAPEQANDSRSVDIRADLYSLGCTLYKLLAGRAPFSSPEYRGTFDKMTAHVREPIPPIRQFASDVPERLYAILDRMLAKEPEGRYAEPAELAEAIEPFCAGTDLPRLVAQAAEATVAVEECSAKPSPEVSRQATVPPRWRRPWLVLTAVGLMLLGSIGGFFLGVVITIKKDGPETRVEVPDGSTARVGADGQLEVTLPGQTKSAQGPPLTPPVAVVSPQRVAGEAKPSVDPAAEFQSLQGPWKVVRVDKGKDADSSWSRIVRSYDYGSDNPATVRQLCFSEGVLDFVSFERGGVWRNDYRVDPAATPKSIDLSQENSGTQTGPLLAVGIYEVAGDRMKLCLRRYLPSLLTQQRPTGFIVEPNSRDVLFTLERYRPSADEEVIGGSRERFSFWTVLSQMEDGKPVSKETLRTLCCYFAQWEFSMSDTDPHGAPRQRTYGKFLLDAEKEPKEIEITVYTTGGGGNSRQNLLGIYKLDGDQLTIAYHKGDPRPTKFASQPGSGVTLLVLERKKQDQKPSERQQPPAAAAPAEPSKPAAAAPLAYRTAKVARGDVVATDHATGTIEPEEVVDVGAQVSGKIVRLGDDPRGKSDPNYKGKLIDFGTPVEEGTALAQIDDTMYPLRVEKESTDCVPSTWKSV